MAFFGLFGNDEEEERGGSSGGILSSIGTALKWVAIAAIAILTLGAIFKFSDTAKNFVDKYTQDANGKGGWGSALAGIFGSAKDTISDAMTSHPSADNVSSNVTIKTQTGEVKVKTFDKSLSEASAVIDLSKTPEAYNKLKDIKAAREELSLEIDPETAKSKSGEMLIQRGKALEFAEKVEAWNELAAKTEQEYKKAGIPTLPTIPMVILGLPPKLKAYGKTTFGDKWETYSPVQQIEFLERNLHSFETPDLKPKFEIAANAVALPGGNITNIDQVVGSSSWAGSAAGRALNADKGTEEHLQSVISELMKQERFTEAKLVADQSAERFSKLASDYKKDHNNKELYKPYSEAMNRFKEISKYTGFLDNRNELDAVTDQAYTSIIAAAKLTPSIAKSHETQLAGATNKGAPIAPSQDKTAEQLAAEALLKAKAAAKAPPQAADIGASGVSNGLEEVNKDAVLPAQTIPAASAAPYNRNPAGKPAAGVAH